MQIYIQAQDRIGYTVIEDPRPSLTEAKEYARMLFAGRGETHVTYLQEVDDGCICYDVIDSETLNQ